MAMKIIAIVLSIIYQYEVYWQILRYLVVLFILKAYTENHNSKDYVSINGPQITSSRYHVYTLRPCEKVLTLLTFQG